MFGRLFLLLVSLSGLSACTPPPAYTRFDTHCCEAQQSFVRNHVETIDVAFVDAAKSRQIGIIPTDVNHDGMEDFIAQIQSSLDCGMNGCGTYLFIDNGHGYDQHYLFNTYQEVKIIPDPVTPPRRYSQIVIHTKEDKECSWGWTGKKYALLQCSDIVPMQMISKVSSYLQF